MDKLRQISLLLVTAVFIFFCIRMVNAYSDVCTEIDADYRSGQAVNLDNEVKAEKIKGVLLKRGYFTDSADAGLVSRTIADSLLSGCNLASLYSLRDNRWKVLGNTISAKGGCWLKERFNQTRRVVGVEYVATGNEPTEWDLNSRILVSRHIGIIGVKNHGGRSLSHEPPIE